MNSSATEAEVLQASVRAHSLGAVKTLSADQFQMLCRDMKGAFPDAVKRSLGQTTIVGDATRLSVTLDAGSVVEGLQSHGFQLALHGHQHVPAITRIDRGSAVDGNVELSHGGGMVVLAAGSAGATRLSDEMRDNSYNVIRVLDKGYSVEAKRFNPGRAPERLYRAAFD